MARHGNNSRHVDQNLKSLKGQLIQVDESSIRHYVIA